MKTHRRFGLLMALALTSTTAAFAQAPPPNDDFADRIILTGSSITFTGTLAGSTVESPETSGFQGYYAGPASGSVWWTWATPVTTRVVIEIPPTPFTANAELAVYTGNAINALTLIDQNMFSEPAGRYVSFLASPTNLYQFRVGGIGTQPFSLKLTATNPPIFIFQPQDCVISPYGSAFFCAMATGPRAVNTPPTSYQWFFNGVPIPSETSPSLLVHSVTTNQAGSYSVIATNIGGMAQSETATLTVIDTNPVPLIVALPPTNSNRAPLFLTGEPGRWYDIESSPDMKSWSFFDTARARLTNSSDVFSITRFNPTHFIRASLAVKTDVCVGQLKQMFWGQKVCAIENRLLLHDFVGPQLQFYIHLTPQGYIYYCPLSGTYSFGGGITNPPTCTFSSSGHRLP